MDTNDKTQNAHANIALVLAAGSSKRIGGPIPKQYLKIGDISLLRRTLLSFIHHPKISSVAAIIRSEHREFFNEASDGLQILPPVIGGEDRQQSVFNGLREMASLKPNNILIHDGARPFISAQIISNVLEALKFNDGAVPAIPVVDSLKRGRDGLIEEEVTRDGLWRAQTPQGFNFPAILSAHKTASKGHTDDAALARKAGLQVALVEGSMENYKITSYADLVSAKARYTEKLIDVRVGQGFDVHRFEPGNTVRLCGIDIPHAETLRGNSDADVALHAVTDAILGAIGDGDIGQHFPPDDLKWRDANSAKFVSFALDRIHALGGRLSHIDVTIICEAPRIIPHHYAMVAQLASITGLDLNRISIKATTTERLGFIGRNEGIAAQAIATVRLPI